MMQSIINAEMKKVKILLYDSIRMLYPITAEHALRSHELKVLLKQLYQEAYKRFVFMDGIMTHEEAVIEVLEQLYWNHSNYEKD